VNIRTFCIILSAIDLQFIVAFVRLEFIVVAILKLNRFLAIALHRFGPNPRLLVGEKRRSCMQHHVKSEDSSRRP
jgi:hypothetical protein